MVFSCFEGKVSVAMKEWREKTPALTRFAGSWRSPRQAMSWNRGARALAARHFLITSLSWKRLWCHHASSNSGIYTPMKKSSSEDCNFIGLPGVGRLDQCEPHESRVALSVCSQSSPYLVIAFRLYGYHSKHEGECLKILTADPRS